MDELHRELLAKRNKYLRDNVIIEDGLLNRMRENGIFTSTMINIIKSEPDADSKMNRMLEMLPKRGPEAYRKFMECLAVDYSWVPENFQEKEVELLKQIRSDSDVSPQIRNTVKEYVRDLARTTRINVAQKRSIEDFLCRHITIDTNLNNTQLPGNRLYGIHKRLVKAIHVSSLDESDQMVIHDILPESVDIDKIEKEVTHLVDRVSELEAIIDGCYEKLGETNRDKDLNDLVYAQRKIALERGIKIEELKDQIYNQEKKVRLAKDREKRAQEASQKIEEEKDEAEKSLETLRSKITKMQEDRIRMGMRMALDLPPTVASGGAQGGPAPGGNVNSAAPPSPRTRSSRSQETGKAVSSKTRDRRRSMHEHKLKHAG